MEATGTLALAEIRAHVATCEQQNVEVLNRLEAQDQILNMIRGLLLFIKRSVNLITWAGSTVGGLAAVVKIWEFMHR